MRFACSCRIAGMPRTRGRDAAEGGRAVAVQMQDVDLLAVDDRRAAPGASADRTSTGRRYVMSTPERLERLLREVLPAQADQRHLESAGSNRGIIQLNRRLTPCIRDPSQPRWSQTCRTFNGRWFMSSERRQPRARPGRIIARLDLTRGYTARKMACDPLQLSAVQVPSPDRLAFSTTVASDSRRYTG